VNGVKRNVGDSITIMSDTDILALWKSTATNVSVTYKANGGTGADIVTSVSTGSSITLSANTFGAPSGHVFDGWSVNGVKKNVGDSITIISDTVILALWKSTATNVSVTYKANGGTGADIVTSVLTGSSITLPANTFGAPSGYVFDGWSVNGVKKNVGDSITITEDTEVLALWITTGGNSSGKKDKEDKEDREIPSPKKDEKSPFVPQSDKGSSKDWSDRVTEDKPVHTLITLKIGSANYQVVENGKTVTKKIDVTPMIYKGRTMIPTRMMAELLGVGVSYNPKAKTTILEYNKNKIELTLGKQTMKINGKERKLSAPMMTKNNRVLLPLTDIQRALKELGLRSEVKWDPSTKSISITK
ncbi:stalk domain-containing protein, partial [Filifactor villosus]